MSTKEKVIQARKAVREKLRLLRLGHLKQEQTLKETFKPVTETLSQLSGKLSTDSDGNITDFINQHGDARLDRTFGVSKRRPYMLGILPINITENTIQIGDREFQRTPGLLELIFLRPTKQAKTLNYTPKDLDMYREILHLTEVHKNADSIPKGQNTLKYKYIIKPLMEVGNSSGDGIDIKHKAVTQQIPEYIYYDDPNELVDRLRLLLASAAAGNTAHSNEVVSIISELRERGIIE